MGRASAWALIVGGLALLAFGIAALAVTIRSAASASLLLAMGLVALVLGLRARKPVMLVQREPPAPPVLTGPVPLPTLDTLERLPEPFSACPRCGYLGVRPPTWQEGAFAGGGQLLGRVQCSRCAYSGLPASFDKREDYIEFVDELNRGVPRA